MRFEVIGSKHLPVLVCVPGLMGGPLDFLQMIPYWSEHFCIVTVDPDVERRENGFNLSLDEVKKVSYNDVAEKVHDYLLTEFSSEKDYYFIGLSLGGKIVYDYAIKFSDSLRGALIVDVGLSSFEESELFQRTEDTFFNLNLNQDWASIKKELRERLPEKNLRILVQTQVYFPNGQPPADWKVGMKNFKAMMDNQAIEDQFADFLKIDQKLNTENRRIRVLKASHLSGMSEQGYSAMKSLKSVDLVDVCDSSHYMYVTHKNLIINQVLMVHSLPQITPQADSIVSKNMDLGL